MYKIRMKAKTVSLIGILTIALLGTGIIVPETGIAGQRSSDELPRVDGETQLFPGYPRQFDGVGVIDRIEDRQLVINDSPLPLSSGVDLHTPRSNHATIGRFGVGDYVGYQLDGSGSVASLWLLKKGKR